MAASILPEPVTNVPIKFEDGAAYERMMGTWSRLVGSIFLDWLAPPPGLKWIDIGCGNGSFTELIVQRCTPAQVTGVDPSDAQLAFARSRAGTRDVVFETGDAMALPYADNSFDIAVMALVLFFVPDPKKGVAEMMRVVKPGGTIAVYVWDILGGGFPQEAIQAELEKMGTARVWPPSASVSPMDALKALWSSSGFKAAETKEITVERGFADFDDYFSTSLLSTTVGVKVAGMPDAEREKLKARVRPLLPADASGRVRATARANAIKGWVPS
jgi:ubiquinone/menaquinone biosynthesis C-methylase UbiE